MKTENIVIKTNIDIQHICLTDLAIRRMHRTYDAFDTFEHVIHFLLTHYI